jgi:hypothetical protein
VKATRFNYYENSNHFKPYHFDAAAFDEEKAKFQNVTIGVSFGAIRDIAFEHAISKNTVSFPLVDGMIYGFNKQVNIDFAVSGFPEVAERTAHCDLFRPPLPRCPAAPLPRCSAAPPFRSSFCRGRPARQPSAVAPKITQMDAILFRFQETRDLSSSPKARLPPAPQP